MINTILGTKVRMTQSFVGDERVGVTVVKVGPCIVTHIKSSEKDGYRSIQLGLGEKKLKNITKPMQGHLKGATNEKMAPRFLREVKVEEIDVKVGDKIQLSDVLSQGDKVAVTGVSKGKGFAGGVKRWGFHGGPKTHGQSDRHRAPGSIGQGTTPGRVLKGKKMAGRMGSDQITTKNLEVITINPETNEVWLKGAVPGNPGSVVIIERIGEMKSPPQEEQKVEEVTEAVEELKVEEVSEPTKEEEAPANA